MSPSCWKTSLCTSCLNCGINLPSAGREHKFYALSKWNWQQTISYSISVKSVTLELSFVAAFELLSWNLSLTYRFTNTYLRKVTCVNCQERRRTQIACWSCLISKKPSFFFIMFRYVFERKGMQTDGRIEARKWPAGIEEEISVPWQP